MTTTTTHQLSEDLLPGILANQAGGHRPLLFAHATVCTMDPLVGVLADADLLLRGSHIAGVGPGLSIAAEDDDALVVDCTGFTIAPAGIETVAVAGQWDRVGSLTPGDPATFGVVPSAHAGPIERLVWYTADAAAIVADGVLQRWNGRRLTAPIDETGPGRAPADSPHLGVWVDETGSIHQELTADGRYDETRGGRPHAYQGAFWLSGDRIVYRDDLGFWAYGSFEDGVLHHGGYVFRRR
ncbi:Atu4866 domain-containing protein [Modestobacter sp. VKM Ac-2983]|uniref:Atu4866 domain-containing protein n=1 Tax=Modestobacter sp. VKM Ac-2983 TaxID=3004137 RepID=UPI0022AB5D8C|nr:Atu4866 domain-containing protein [Modestobacter sp. VKM Ac-2983]MCZ2805915.1 Atu4866 domain-containing protein [Modestobacter sp. VKM Ac-2983]